MMQVNLLSVSDGIECSIRRQRRAARHRCVVRRSDHRQQLHAASRFVPDRCCSIDATTTSTTSRARSNMLVFCIVDSKFLCFLNSFVLCVFCFVYANDDDEAIAVPSSKD